MVGIGPGKPEGMTIEAENTLKDCEVLVGYPLYLSLLSPEFDGKERLSTEMTREEERCRMALREADAGRKTALVCSGDPGVYGLAGLVLKMKKDYPEVTVRVIPGVTAATAGAALLGAPLISDFAVISLSDRLTPPEKIRNRLRAAAQGDFVIVIYNPESHGRAGYLAKACELLLEELPEDRPAAAVTRIGREGESVWTGTLGQLKERPADMYTTVFIGSSATEKQDELLITERGYSQKESTTRK